MCYVIFCRELVAMHLKRQGQYICRTLSYHGCDFRVDEQALDAAALHMYDQAAKFWIHLYEQLEYNLAHGGLAHFSGKKNKKKDKARAFEVPDDYVDSGSDSNSDSESESDFSDSDDDLSISSDESDWGGEGEEAPLKLPENESRARQTILRYFWSKSIYILLLCVFILYILLIFSILL